MDDYPAGDYVGNVVAVHPDGTMDVYVPGVGILKHNIIKENKMVNATNNYGARLFEPAMMDQHAVWIDKERRVIPLDKLEDEHLQAIMDWFDIWWPRHICAKYYSYRQEKGDHINLALREPDGWRKTFLGNALVAQQNKRKLKLESEAHAEVQRAVMSVMSELDGRRMMPRETAYTFTRKLKERGYKIVKA